MRILCTGDVHLGRRPSRIPIDQVPDQSPFSTKTMWERIVTLAIDESVDALLISGDLVDHDNRFFEALGPAEAGIARLALAGIPAFAVAGNHDYNVLPALAERTGGGLRLIGAKQQWERLTLHDGEGRARLHIDGWSFAAEHVDVDPLLSYPAWPAVDAPVIGLLHTDLDQTGSRYAPTRLADLHARSVAAWLIGHVHVPNVHARQNAPPVLYPGSPAPLDPGEPGLHGVWFLDVEPATPATFTFKPFAALRYQPIEIDVSGIEDARAAATKMIDDLDAHARAAYTHRDGDFLEHILYRATLTGRASLGADRFERFESAKATAGNKWSIESIIDHTRPIIDLEAISAESSPPGFLARMLLEIEQSNLPPALLHRARLEIEASDVERGLVDYDPSEDQGREVELIESAAWTLLETLIEQQAATR